MNKKVEMGDKVKCKLTGFTGIVSGHAIPLHGEERFSVQPPVDKDGKIPEAFDIDACQLEVLAKSKIEITPPMEHDIDLGDQVEDPISKLKGTVTAKVIFLNGCVHMAVTPKMNKKENVIPNSSWINVERLKLIARAEKKVNLTAEKRTPGGPITKSLRF